MNKKIFVSGSSGFLGSHLVDILQLKGNNVISFDKSEKSISGKKNTFTGDILDYKSVEKAIKGCEIVCHFAAVSDIQESFDDPKKTLEVNIIGTLNILKACIKNNVKKFVFASSIYVYSKYGSFYRISKQSSEKLIEEYSRQYNLNYMILRFGSLYGTRSNFNNSIYNMIYNALKYNKIERDGDGNEIREYIHVKDAVQICYELLTTDIKSEYYMITGKQSLKIKDTLKIINEILQKNIKIEFNKNKTHHYEVTPFSYDNVMAKKITPNSYIDLGQGILEVIHEINSKENK